MYRFFVLLNFFFLIKSLNQFVGILQFAVRYNCLGSLLLLLFTRLSLFYKKSGFCGYFSKKIYNRINRVL